MTEDIEGVETQAADIRFLISSAYALPQVDTAHIAVVGFSWGGISNVFAAAKDDRIGALVSLDGTIRYYPQFVDGGSEAAKYVTPERVAVPLLFIGAHPKSMETLSSQRTLTHYSFLNAMKYSDVYIATMRPMVHADFASDSLRVRPPEPDAEYTRAEVLDAYNWTVRYVGQFLDAYLKNSASARAFLQKPPKDNGAPRHMMTLEQRPAKATPPDFEHFSMELSRSGYANAIPIYKRMQQLDPKFRIGEPQINLWGYTLLRAGRGKDAIEILKLGVSVYPEAWNLYDSLAEMYEADGDKPQALANYRRSLELNPKNTNAIQHLKGLEK